MAFWIALVFRGTRCAGLREQECNAYEEKSLHFPNDFPDTLAGDQYQQDLEKEKVEKYNRIPASKKPNFTKYGIVSPFSCPWDLLVKEWKKGKDGNGGSDHSKTNDDTGNVNNKDVNKIDMKGAFDQVTSQSDKECRNIEKFYVLRNVKLLRKLQNICHVSRNRSQKGKLDVKNEVLNILEKDHGDSLVPVRLDMIQKGSPGQFATICVPNKEDIELLNKNKNYGGPMEPLHVDPVLVEKKVLKKQLKQKGLKQKVKVDRTLKLTSEKDEMTVRTGCRDVIGYLNSGGYSLGTGNGGGVGFVSTLALITLLRNSEASENEPIVLVRGSTSLQYRFARLSVIA
jgi:ribonuclease P/MRP protein subunit POP1